MTTIPLEYSEVDEGITNYVLVRAQFTMAYTLMKLYSSLVLYCVTQLIIFTLSVKSIGYFPERLN